MKKIIISNLLLIGLFTITACDNSSTNEELSLEEEMLEKMQTGGFQMSGKIKQTRQQVGVNTSGELVLIGTPERNTYDSTFVYQEKDNIAMRRTTTQTYAGENVVTEDRQVYRDENGLLYTTSLDYTNSVVKTYSTNAYEINSYMNFAKLLIPSDITRQVTDSGEIHYNINLDKGAVITNYVFTYLNSGFKMQPLQMYFTVDENETTFESLYIEMDGRFNTESDGYYTYLYYYENECTMELSDIGAGEVDNLTPFPEKAENAVLKEALSSVDGNNMTVKITDTSYASDGSTILSVDYTKIFYDGSEIYVRNWDDSTGDENMRNENDFLLKPDSASDLLYSYIYDSETETFVKNSLTYFPSLYQGTYYYEDLLPIVSDVSGDLFNYNPTTNFYVGEASMVSALAKCFYVGKAPLRSTNLQSASEINIRLNDNNEIVFVQADYSYIDSSYNITSGTIKIEYSNIGSTVLPA